MCGRYTTGTEIENIRFKEIIEEANAALEGSGRVTERDGGDVYPSDIAAVMLSREGQGVFTGMKWGFFFGGRLVINARSETAAEKPMFKNALQTCRCLVPAAGYYEWNAQKEKFLFTDPDGYLIYMAGLYRAGEEGLPEFSILTREAVGEGREVHARMPLLIRDRELWLAGGKAYEALINGGDDIKLAMHCQSPRQLSMF